MNRSFDALARNQSEILNDYRQELQDRNIVAVLPRSSSPTPFAVFARVSGVVTPDATYGPHLLVIIQTWSGTPPVVSDSTAAEIRCYPTPNHTVTDYSVNDQVQLLTAHGAMVAEKLA